MYRSIAENGWNEGAGREKGRYKSGHINGDIERLEGEMGTLGLRVGRVRKEEKRKDGNASRMEGVVEQSRLWMTTDRGKRMRKTRD